MLLYITMSMIRWIRKAELCPPLSWHCRTENFLFFTDFSFPAVPPLSPPRSPRFQITCFFCFCVDLCVSVSLTLGLIYLCILSLPCTLRRYSPDLKHDVIPRFSRPFPSFFFLCGWPPLEITKSWENRCYTCRCCCSPHVFFLLLSSSRNKSSLFFLPPQPCLTSARPPLARFPRPGRPPIRAPGITEPEPNLEPSLFIHHNLKFVVRKKAFGPIAADEPHNCQARHNTARPHARPPARQAGTKRKFTDGRAGSAEHRDVPYYLGSFDH